MTKYTVKIEVIDILGEGNCSMNQKVGDAYNYPDDRGKMCPSSFCTLYPWIMVMLSGGSFTDEGDGSDFMPTGCPDYKHQVVYNNHGRLLKNNNRNIFDREFFTYIV